MKKVANFISIIGHPLLTIPIFVTIVMFGFKGFLEAVLISSLIVGGIFIPVILWMYIKSKNGTYTNFDVSDKNQRKSLFLFVIPLLIVVTVALFLTNQSRNLCISVLFALILTVISQFINFFVKSSLHVSLNTYLAALIFTMNFEIGIVVFLFTGLLSWSRVKLGRHTIKEVLFGLSIGTLIGLIMLVTEGFIEI
ncbi:MAG TPA: hypothetical protein VGK38_00085 [Prolixibacteraceae bacterium]